MVFCKIFHAAFIQDVNLDLKEFFENGHVRGSANSVIVQGFSFCCL